MKKAKLNLFVAAVIIAAFNYQSAYAYARIHRVNNLSNFNAPTNWGENFGGTSQHPVYKTITDAVNSALVLDNDTVYLEGTGSGVSYAGVSLTRPLVFIGAGYFLQMNQKVSNDYMDTKVSSMGFSTGSSGSQFIGIHITGVNGIDINTNNITIRRCLFDQAANISIGPLLNTINIIQNIFDNPGNVTSSAIIFNVNGGVTDLVINFNIFQKPLLVLAGSNTYNVLQCNNNVFHCPAIAGNPSIKMMCTDFKNNIIRSSNISVSVNGGLSSSGVSYNTIGSATQLDTSAAYNNKYVSNMQTLFVAPSGSTDGDYQLQQGVANNFPGAGSGDRGAFGGVALNSRYTLSGLAPIPVVYDIFTTGVASPTTGLPVTIKARTIK